MRSVNPKAKRTCTRRVGEGEPSPVPARSFARGWDEANNQDAMMQPRRANVPGAQSCAPGISTVCLLREGIRTNLELHQLARRSLSAFDVRHRFRGIGRPDAPALPPSLRIVDAAVEQLRIEPLRIGDTQNGKLLALRRQGHQPL